MVIIYLPQPLLVHFVGLFIIAINIKFYYYVTVLFGCHVVCLATVIALSVLHRFFENVCNG